MVVKINWNEVSRGHVLGNSVGSVVLYLYDGLMIEG